MSWVFLWKTVNCPKPHLLRKEEFLEEEMTFNYINLDGEPEEFRLEKNSLGFTYCQVPVIYKIEDKEKITVFMNDRSRLVFDGLHVDTIVSSSLFERKGEIQRIEVAVVK